MLLGEKEMMDLWGQWALGGILALRAQWACQGHRVMRVFQE